MHKYIDLNKKLDFSNKNIDFEYILNDLRKYNIQNIREDYDDEFICALADVLYSDYEYHIANYQSYIEKNMNIRVLMELRKSAVLPFEFLDPQVYEWHKDANTVQDIKDVRMRYFQQINSDYKDEDWQYVLLVKHYIRCFPQLRKRMGNNWEEYFHGFLCDYQDCFADGDPDAVKGIDDYVRDFVNAHMQGYNPDTYWS